MTAVPRLSGLTPADRELVAAIAAGSLEALGQLFERFEPLLRRYVGRLGIGAGDVDDLVQATFLEVVRAAPRFDPKYSPRGWLFGIATLMVRRHQRSVGRAAARVAAWAQLVRSDLVPTPAEIFEGDEATRRVTIAFERLSSKKREVFVLITLEGLSGEEAANILGIPVSTVWTRLHHARLELRTALEDREP